LVLVPFWFGRLGQTNTPNGYQSPAWPSRQWLTALFRRLNLWPGSKAPGRSAKQRPSGQTSPSHPREPGRSLPQPRALPSWQRLSTIRSRSCVAAEPNGRQTPSALEPRANASATRPVRWASMKTEPPRSDGELLAGLVERVTYQNAENGFCVIRVKARGHRDLVTVVGYAAVMARALAAPRWQAAQATARFQRVGITLPKRCIVRRGARQSGCAEWLPIARHEERHVSRCRHAPRRKQVAEILGRHLPTGQVSFVPHGKMCSLVVSRLNAAGRDVFDFRDGDDMRMDGNTPGRCRPNPRVPLQR
jgi:hypothetical protein